MNVNSPLFQQAAAHHGSCRCWRCLLWWTVLAPKEDFGPFDDTERNRYLARGLSFTVYDAADNLRGQGVMRHNQIESADPDLAGIATMEDLEQAAAQRCWTIFHEYTEVRSL